MKIAITGANGYVGSSLMETLRPDHEVVGTCHTRLSEDLLWMDIRDRSAVAQALLPQEPEVIVHAAGVAYGYGEDIRDVNIMGTNNIVQVAERVGAGVIFLSSAAVFNGQEGHFNEDSPTGSAQIYGQTKIDAERLVLQAAVDHLVVRPSLMVGIAPHTADHTFSGKLRTAIITETPLALDDAWRFSPSWSQDLAATIRWWLDNRQTDLLHIGTAETTTQLAFGQRVAAQLNTDPALLMASGGPSFKHNILDSSRACTQPFIGRLFSHFGVEASLTTDGYIVHNIDVFARAYQQAFGRAA
jgi:dTDP-4-dehydrorhamnose reductase